MDLQSIIDESEKIVFFVSVVVYSPGMASGEW